MANLRRTVGLLLALPLLALVACDSDSGGNSPLKGGAPGTGGTPGTGTNPGTGPAAGNPILGVWGLRQGMEGEVWEFYADGQFQLNSYVLQNNTLYREITFGGTFTAANGALTVTRQKSTCADAQAGPVNLSYTVAGTKLSVTVNGMTFSYTKGDAPNPDAQPMMLGCFDQNQMGAFVPGPYTAITGI
jgi:hypothetical protein